MKKAILFIIAFTLITCFYTIAQVRKIAGLVTCNNQLQSSAVIKNVNLHTQTISNERGEFALPVKAGDTLISSKEGYIKDTLPVTDQPFFIIQLKKNPLMLKEVVINSTPITAEETYAENKKDYKEIYRKGDKSHMIVVTPLGVGVEVDKVWSAVSKEGKDARHMQRRLTTDYKSNVINHRFTKTLVGRITGYKGNKLDDFIVKYRPTFEMVQKATDYELIEYIKKKLAEDKRI